MTDDLKAMTSSLRGTAMELWQDYIAAQEAFKAAAQVLDWEEAEDQAWRLIDEVTKAIVGVSDGTLESVLVKLVLAVESRPEGSAQEFAAVHSAYSEPREITGFDPLDR